MTKRGRIDAKTAAYVRESKAWWAEREQETNTPEYQESLAKFRRDVEAEPLIGVIFRNAFYINASSSTKRDAEAVGVLIDRLERLLQDEPALKASREVSQALREVILSLECIGWLDAGYMGVISAFAAPSKSLTNQLNASKSRRPKNMMEAAALFDKWAENPDLYANMAAFKRDVMEKEYCKDIGTAGRWTNEFRTYLEPDSPLALKLQKK